jgi:hypothetical protein
VVSASASAQAAIRFGVMVLARPGDEPGRGRRTDAATGGGDGAPQCLRVGGVLNER